MQLSAHLHWIYCLAAGVTDYSSGLLRPFVDLLRLPFGLLRPLCGPQELWQNWLIKRFVLTSSNFFLNTSQSQDVIETERRPEETDERRKAARGGRKAAGGFRRVAGGWRAAEGGRRAAGGDQRTAEGGRRRPKEAGGVISDTV